MFKKTGGRKRCKLYIKGSHELSKTAKSPNYHAALIQMSENINL